MPQPVFVNIKIDPGDLEKKPELATQIAKISSYWAEIEQELAVLYGLAIKTMPVLAVTALGRVNSLLAKLEMIQLALKLSCPAKYEKKFDKELKQEIRKCASARNKVIHCQWTIHEDYPECLIRCSGLSDPQVSCSAYEKRDFLEIQIRLLSLHVALKEFSRTLVLDPDYATHPIGGWQLGAHPQPDQQGAIQSSPPFGPSGWLSRAIHRLNSLVPWRRRDHEPFDDPDY